PFIQQFHKSPMGALLHNDPDWQKLNAGREQAEALLGLDWTKLRDDILGDAVVFAYRPGKADQPNTDQALILLRARDPQALAKLVERINALQKAGGEVKAVEAREHNGLSYFQRVDAKAAPFYALLGPVLAVSSDEAFLREALGLRSRGAAGEPVLAQRLRQLLGAEKRVASFWINPRAFDAAVTAKAEQVQDAQKAVLANFLSYWKAVDGAAVGVGLQEDFTLTLAVRARTERLSPAARRFFAEAAKPSDLWRRFPANAMFAFAGRFDASAIEEMLGEFLTPQTRRALHDGLDRFVGAALDKNVVKDVLPCIGPDFGFCVTPPDDDAKSWLPNAVLALRVRPGDKPPYVDQSLFAALTGLAQAAVIDHNGKHAQRMTFKTQLQDRVEVKYLAGAAHLPAGLEPAFALKDGYLVVASSPEAIRRFEATAAPPPAGEAPLLRISLKEVRRYVEARRPELAAALAEHGKTASKDVEKQLDELLLGLRAFDRLEISQRSADGQAALTLRVRMALPLKK
ncbi:MAG TPA: DUF3352 domain-containing protein, partial [Gemmataceae bacterium]|nr:DUF3352 domain-containing protein [Gemmataceae bacterium]